MKTFAHFTTNGNENLGSDAWYRLDSRNSLNTQKQDARDRIRELRFVKPDYNGFQIRTGESLGRTRIVYAE